MKSRARGPSRSKRPVQPAFSSEPLWTADGQTNLTKAVTLRLFQALLMQTAVAEIQDVLRTRETLMNVLKDEEVVDEQIAEQVEAAAIPATVEDFKERLRDGFLHDGVPVRFFERPWVTSLDDSQGLQNLADELEKAYTNSKRPDVVYRTRNKDVFAVPD